LIQQLLSVKLDYYGAYIKQITSMEAYINW